MKNFDELLDGVLREDAAAEPRAGLKGRVMARVHADGPRRPVWRFAAWGAVAAALPACIVALLIWPRSVPPVQRTESTSMVAVSTLPKKTVSESTRNREPRIVSVKPSVRHESAAVMRTEGTLPKLEVFPTPSTVAEPVRELVALSRQHPGQIVPGLADLSAEHKPSAELKIAPIEIARIEIAPLNPVSDTRAVKEPLGK